MVKDMPDILAKDALGMPAKNLTAMPARLGEVVGK
jgi:hypothetical protein